MTRTLTALMLVTALLGGGTVFAQPSKKTAELITRLGTAPVNEQLTIIRELLKTQDVESAAAIAAQLKSPAAPVRLSAAKALAKLSSDAMRAEAAKTVLPLLTSEDRLARASALDAAGSLKLKDAVLILLDILKNEKDPLRSRAASALGQIGDPAAIKPLLQAMSSPGDWQLQAAAAAALGELQYKPAAPVIIDLYKNANLAAKITLARALGTLKSTEAVSALGAGAADSDLRVKLTAIAALKEIGSPDAGVFLVPALGDAEPSIRAAAADALAKCSAENQLPDLEKYAGTEKDEAVKAAFGRAITALSGGKKKEPAPQAGQ
ncbi:MAG: HEAT repeat domain-containing protein [Elusimicrobiaceae bacterium]|nr:HEAT repeat domain-containing protein [Elusimicrobiaceae bacterium]